MSLFTFKKTTKIGVYGFTLVELMVTITIVVLVTGIVLLQYSAFNSSVLLTSQAYKTAFDLREAQSLAVSVRGQEGRFQYDYGLYFDADLPNEYILFQNTYTGPGEAVPAYTKGQDLVVGPSLFTDPRFHITDICTTASGNESCNRNSVTVTFKRPDFEAQFRSGTSNATNVINARIIFSPITDDTKERSVRISSTGQISVD